MEKSGLGFRGKRRGKSALGVFMESELIPYQIKS
jgi:hypothetical protein